MKEMENIMIEELDISFSDITLDSDIMQNSNIDSLSAIVFLKKIEERFDLFIDYDKYIQLNTLEKIINYILTEKK